MDISVVLMIFLVISKFALFVLSQSTYLHHHRHSCSVSPPPPTHRQALPLLTIKLHKPKQKKKKTHCPFLPLPILFILQRLPPPMFIIRHINRARFNPIINDLPYKRFIVIEGEGCVVDETCSSKAREERKKSEEK